MRPMDTIILSTAKNILANEGYAAFSIERLEKESALGSSFYISPLAQKTVLFHTIVTTFYQKAADEIASAFKPGLSLKDTLHQYIEAYLQYISDNRAEARAVFQIIKFYQDEDGNSVYEPEKVALYQPLTEVLTDCPNLMFPAPLMAQLIHCVTDTIATELMNDRLLKTEQVIEKSASLFDFITQLPEQKNNIQHLS